MIDLILEKAARVPERLKLSRVNAIDRGDGKTLAGLVNIYPAIVTQFLAQVEQTLGINLMGKTPLPAALDLEIDSDDGETASNGDMDQSPHSDTSEMAIETDSTESL